MSAVFEFKRDGQTHEITAEQMRSWWEREAGLGVRDLDMDMFVHYTMVSMALREAPLEFLNEAGLESEPFLRWQALLTSHWIDKHGPAFLQ